MNKQEGKFVLSYVVVHLYIWSNVIYTAMLFVLMELDREKIGPHVVPASEVHSLIFFRDFVW